MTRTVNQREVIRRREARIERENMERMEEENMNLREMVVEHNARVVPANLVPFIAGEVAPGQDPNADAGESGLHAAFGGVAPQRCGINHQICLM